MTIGDHFLCFRTYTIEWYNNNVWLRQGFDNMLIEYEDSSLLVVTEVRMFTLDTPGFWQFQNNMGECQLI